MVIVLLDEEDNEDGLNDRRPLSNRLVVGLVEISPCLNLSVGGLGEAVF